MTLRVAAPIGIQVVVLKCNLIAMSVCNKSYKGTNNLNKEINNLYEPLQISFWTFSTFINSVGKSAGKVHI